VHLHSNVIVKDVYLVDLVLMKIIKQYTINTEVQMSYSLLNDHGFSACGEVFDE